MDKQNVIRKDISGRKFGKLTAINPSESKKGFWVFACDCGNSVERQSKAVAMSTKNGSICSCMDCVKIVRAMSGRKNNRNKGSVSNKKLYDVHRQMMRRCYDAGSADYKNYGGRGIIICHEWHDPQGFYSWCEKSGYHDGVTIERSNVNGNYEPDNCTWIDNKMQARNTRKVTRILFDGRFLSLPEWSDILGIKQKTIKSRLRYGWTIEATLTTEVLK